jgi:hypothetical protein
MGGINKTAFALTSSKSFESEVFPSKIQKLNVARLKKFGFSKVHLVTLCVKVATTFLGALYMYTINFYLTYEK